MRRVGRLVLDRTVDNFFAETEQVAFCTQNVVPGIDFTNDPLLQGRNFSYLDTQLKRLGGPNFTHLPVNAPKCPVAHFQQDGHMAMHNPVGRVNYEPNSWSGDGGRPARGPGRRLPQLRRADRRHQGSASAPRRFADHYSQARQFYVSQTPVEQAHIVDAFVFELSKCEQPGIRARMVANLRNVDEDFARRVADGLRLDPLPEPSHPARQPITDLPPSPALSIVAQRAGQLRRPQDRRARHRRHRRRAAGVAARGGHRRGRARRARRPADRRRRHQRRQARAGPPEDRRRPVGALRRRRHPRHRPTAPTLLAKDAAAKDFVSDAHAHCKFIGYVPEAQALLEAVVDLDDGYVALDGDAAIATFLEHCRTLRYWDRTPTVDQT